MGPTCSTISLQKVKVSHVSLSLEHHPSEVWAPPEHLPSLQRVTSQIFFSLVTHPTPNTEENKAAHKNICGDLGDIGQMREMRCSNLRLLKKGRCISTITWNTTCKVFNLDYPLMDDGYLGINGSGSGRIHVIWSDQPKLPIWIFMPITEHINIQF